MASCKPVVASNIDGYRDVIGDGTEGILVPPRDSAALARAICTLLGDADLRAIMGERGRERAAAFSWPQIASRITEYYESLIEQQTYSTTPQHQRLFAFL